MDKVMNEEIYSAKKKKRRRECGGVTQTGAKKRKNEDSEKYVRQRMSWSE